MLSRETLRFLAELEDHNDKAWFQANKSRYQETVLEPALELVRDMQPRLRKISTHIVADDRKSGGSLSRIYRDVRFSKDKRPYNPQVMLMFHHAVGKKVSAPGFYLSVTPDEITVGTGIWQPETAAVNKIRQHIVDETRAWRAAKSDAGFMKVFGGLAGESLKRPPRGFDAEHPEVEDLKRKDFVGFCTLKPSMATRKDFPDRLESSYRSSQKLMRFLCRALELDY